MCWGRHIVVHEKGHAKMKKMLSSIADMVVCEAYLFYSVYLTFRFLGQLCPPIKVNQRGLGPISVLLCFKPLYRSAEVGR